MAGACWRLANETTAAHTIRRDFITGVRGGCTRGTAAGTTPRRLRAPAGVRFRRCIPVDRHGLDRLEEVEADWLFAVGVPVFRDSGEEGRLLLVAPRKSLPKSVRLRSSIQARSLRKLSRSAGGAPQGDGVDEPVHPAAFAPGVPGAGPVSGMMSSVSRLRHRSAARSAHEASSCTAIRHRRRARAPAAGRSALSDSTHIAEVAAPIAPVVRLASPPLV